MKKKRIIIIGGGFAGIQVAKKIKRHDVEILLLDQKNHHLFQPLLYQVASAALSPADIAYPLREIFKNKPNITVYMGEVSQIDKTKKTVYFADKSFEYDYLIVATGARHSYFGHAEWERLAPGLKTLGDALNIREKILMSFEQAEKCENEEEINRFLTFVVIGAGPTGVEMAGSIAEIANTTMIKNFRHIDPQKTKVYLIEAASRVLPPFPAPLSAKAEKDLKEMNVTVLLNTKVTNITDKGVETDHGFIPASNVMWAAGNQASTLLKTLDVPLDKQGRVIVGPDLTIPEYSDVFVIGDAACVMDKDNKPLPGVATVAIQQGCYVGRLLHKMTPPHERKPFSYFDKGSLATIGKYRAVGSFRGWNFSGLIAWLLWAFIHIFYLVGFRNRYSVLLEWYFHYVSGLRGARLITKDLPTKK